MDASKSLSFIHNNALRFEIYKYILANLHRANSDIVDKCSRYEYLQVVNSPRISKYILVYQNRASSDNKSSHYLEGANFAEKTLSIATAII